MCHWDKLLIKRDQNLLKSIRKMYICNLYKNTWKEWFSKGVSPMLYLQFLFIQTYRKNHNKVGSIAAHRKYYFLKLFEIIKNHNMINFVLAHIK